MANFGLTDLRLVAPRDGWPNREGARRRGRRRLRRRSGARSIDASRRRIGELNFVLATTARPREMVKTVLTPESAARELQRAAAQGSSAPACCSGRSGVVSTTTCIALADAILTAPVNPDFASLSLPQAVLLFGYEWLKARRPRAAARSRHRVRRTRRRGHLPSRHAASDARASCSLCSSISKPSSTGPAFFIRPRSAPRWCAAIRNMFHRMGATEQDVRTWRGIVAALSRARQGQGR